MSSNIARELTRRTTEIEELKEQICQRTIIRARSKESLQSKAVQNFNEFSKYCYRASALANLQDRILIHQHWQRVITTTKATLEALELSAHFPTSIGQQLLVYETASQASQPSRSHSTPAATKTAVIASGSTPFLTPIQEKSRSEHQLVSRNLLGEIIDSANELFSEALENTATVADTTGKTGYESIVESEESGQISIPPAKMAAEKKKEFVKYASGIIPSYDGSPEDLDQFLDAIELIRDAHDVEADVLALIKLKMTGKARKYLAPPPGSINELVATLKREIKPPKSNIIISKLNSLKFNNNQVLDFTKQAEDLADQLQRALTFELGNQRIAAEKTSEEVIKICRTNARTSEARSIIACQPLGNPSAILAKFADEAVLEKENESKLLYVRNNYGQRPRGRQQRGRNYNDYRHESQGRDSRSGDRRGSYDQRRDYSNNRNSSRNRSLSRDRRYRYESRSPSRERYDSRSRNNTRNSSSSRYVRKLNKSSENLPNPNQELGRQ